MWRGSCCYVTNTQPNLFLCTVIFYTTPSFWGFQGHFLSKYQDLTDGLEFSDDRVSMVQMLRNGDIRERFSNPETMKFKNETMRSKEQNMRREGILESSEEISAVVVA